MKDPRWLLDHQRNVHSQYGEDGILEQILDTLPDGDKWCVDVGAFDGLWLSNTRHLVESRGFRAVLIEPNDNVIPRLEENYRAYPKCITAHGYAGFNEDDGLDNILSKTEIPKNFDVLSIDVDGNDYHVWKVVEQYRPKCVIVEYNPTMGTPLKFIQVPDYSVSVGSSLDAIVDLGKEKGYELVATTHSNAIFVDKQYFPFFEIADNSTAALRADERWVSYMFYGYDGTKFLAGIMKCPWSQVPIDEVQESEAEPVCVSS